MIAFATLELNDQLHVTLARRYDATAAEVTAMAKEVEKLKELLPFSIKFGNFCSMGEFRNIAAYKVRFIYDVQRQAVEAFYRRFYKETPGNRIYNEPKFHVTINNNESKRKLLEDWMRANPDGVWKINDLNFNTVVDNRADRPREQKKPDFWPCLSNTCLRYGTPTRNPLEFSKCINCDSPREDFKKPADVYAEPPSAPPARAVAKQPYQGKRPDWMCPKCNFKVFGSKDQCGKCGSKNPN